MAFPPNKYIKQMGMHWLSYETPDKTTVYMALQWNPGTKTWTHCDDHALGSKRVFETEGWDYLYRIPYPYE